MVARVAQLGQEMAPRPLDTREVRIGIRLQTRGERGYTRAPPTLDGMSLESARAKWFDNG